MNDLYYYVLKVNEVDKKKFKKVKKIKNKIVDVPLYTLGKGLKNVHLSFFFILDVSFVLFSRFLAS